MKKLFVTIIVMLVFFSLERVSAEQTHIQRSGINLVPNPDFSGSTGWVFGGSAVYDPSVTRDAGTGSLKLPAAGSYINSGLIAITPGKTYTLSNYMSSGIFPPPLVNLLVAYYNSSKVFVRNAWASNQSVTVSASWQECVYLFRPQPGEVYAKIKTALVFQPIGYNGTVWIDNYYLGEDIGFEQPPTAKTAFNGVQTKVDSLGNVEIYKNGAWTPFFPIGIYADSRRADFKDYSNQGFNTQMWVSDYTGIQQAKDATSAFNPDGMMSSFQIANYTNTGVADYGNLTKLATRINGIKTNKLMGSLLWYYWDNENSYAEWDNPLAVINKIKELDVDAGNKRMHPIYALQGNEGIARKYNCANVVMTDIIGDYITQDSPSANPEETRCALGIVTLWNVEQQKNPVVMAQINHGVGMLFRPRVFTAIAKGAKGFAFWKDDIDGGTKTSDALPLEDQPWWNDLPNIRSEIDKMMPIIRMPHWTEWSLSSNNSLTDFGTRDYQGKGYVIVTNEQSTAQNVTFTISGLSYAANTVRDFIIEKIETAIDDNNQFAVLIPAYGSKVYVLEYVPEVYTPPSNTAGPAKMPASGSKCDLIVNKVWWAAPPVAGQPLNVKFQVSNIGTAKTSAGAAVQQAKVYVDNVKVAKVNYDDIAPKSTVTLTAVIPGASIVSGKQTKVMVWADATDKVAEIRETNNTGIASFIIETRPDLIVKEITLSPKPVAKKPLVIYFKIGNVGAAATAAGSGAQTAVVFVDGKPAGTVSYDDVPKGGSITKQLILPSGIAVAGTRKIKVSADTNNIVGEINELNNSLEKSFPIAK